MAVRGSVISTAVTAGWPVTVTTVKQEGRATLVYQKRKSMSG